MKDNSFDKTRFSMIEKNLSLFERSYNGFFYWQYIRFYVCESLFGNRVELLKIENSKKKSIIFKFLELVLAQYISIKEKIFFLNRKNYDLLFFTDVSSNDKFFDSWSLPSNLKVLNFRTAKYSLKLKDNYHYLEYPRIQMKIKQEIYKILNLYRFHIDDSERQFLNELEGIFLSEFGQVISAAEMEKAIQDLIIEDRCYTHYYNWLIKKTNCKFIALVCYYQTIYFPILKIAREQGIKIIEFQHGVINNHEEYWFEDDRGVNNYTPNYLLTFGDVHNSWIKLVKGSEAIPIGFPFQEQSIKKVSQIIPDDKLIIIYPESDSRFEKLLDDFINKITLEGYKVIIKIHPLQVENVSLYYPLLSKNNNASFITKDNTEGIYYYLKKAKHHIMASTTVGLEAVAFDHTNICINVDIPHDQTQCLIDWGVARGFSTAEELIDLIILPAKLNDEQRKMIRNKLWKTSACDNMTVFFDSLFENNRYSMTDKI